MSEKLPPLPDPDDQRLGSFQTFEMRGYALRAIRESEAVRLLREAQRTVPYTGLHDRIDTYLASLEQK